MNDESLADRLAAQLSRYLGPNNARVAVRTFALKTIGCSPEQLQPRHLPQIFDSLKPMLNTLVGRQAAETALEHLQEEFGT
ncbi:MAG: hypothetical protein DRI34_13185 [Deltaproteobacteria bacterium]|nr:MAG: hypothetical protein DRI34_13185 [Deltaproteobacteria bacterium]